MAVTTAGLEGIVAAESKICYIDGDAGILSYQGYNIHTLAEHATFEEVIYLLWYGRLPKQAELDQLKAALVANRAIPAEVTAFLKGAGKAVPMDFFLFPVTYAISSLQPAKTANTCTLHNGLDTGYFAAYLEGHSSV